VASILDDRYLRVGPPRPVREFRLGRALEELEVPTPAHIGAAVYPAGPFYRGDLVTRYVPDSRDLADVLFPGRSLEGGAGQGPGDVVDPGVEPVVAMERAGALVRLLHDRGVHHPDLNIKNILLAGHDPVRALILDLDRATLRARLAPGARQRVLDRFWRSVAKWEAGTGHTLDPSVREGFRDGYGG
jgi:3-deoxy-D-manno-octulosonic acid kinase